MINQSINTIVSRFFRQTLPTRSNAFSCQSRFFKYLVDRYISCPLYTSLGIKQVQLSDCCFESSSSIKSYIAQFPLIEYKDHILPLVESDLGITHIKSDFTIITSGTSDANRGGKIIPAQRNSLRLLEQSAIQRTIAQYLSENTNSTMVWGSAFTLTAPFDNKNKSGYISGCMRYFSPLGSMMLYPSGDVLGIINWKQKKEAIIDELLHKKPYLRSIHGVPARPLEIIDELIYRDPVIATQILSQLEYVSIGGGPALDYKQQFQDKLLSLGLHQKIFGSNNHNASEGFLGSQVKNFSDLEYHQMSPMMYSNFYLFVPVEYFTQYKNDILSYADMVVGSHLLHEVEYEREYLMMFANDRIPWLYNIKDKVVFQKNDELSDSDTILEYIVTGRYGMSSNIFNEHLELEHILSAFDYLQKRGYIFDRTMFVAGMQLTSNKGIFHIIVESDISFDQTDFISQFDDQLGAINDQWAIFRQRSKISNICLYVAPGGFVRNALITLGKMHEQSKIPHLSDHNYEHIIDPLLTLLTNTKKTHTL